MFQHDEVAQLRAQLLHDKEELDHLREEKELISRKQQEVRAEHNIPLVHYFL